MSKRWADFNFAGTVEMTEMNAKPVVLKPKISNKILKSSSRKNNPNIKSTHINGNGKEINFFDELEPQCIEDLSVHIKKVSEVEQWLQRSTTLSKNVSAILLLTGPSGCGKSITVKVLCKAIGAELNEWTNPVDLDFESYRKQTDQFKDFLFESKYASLFSKKRKQRVSLVKDLPNIFLREPKEFQPILEQYYLNSNGPVIFIYTDVASSEINLKDKLFPDDVKHKFSIENISFNPASATLLKSALKRAETLIKSNLDIFKLPDQNIVNSIIVSNGGDLRCALNQYYFASLPGTSDLPIHIALYESQNTKRKRANQKPVSKVKQMCKDEVLGLFHSIGRVLSPKWQENSAEPRLNCDMNLLVDEFLTYPNAAVGFLYENYPKHFGMAQDICEAADILSYSQIFVDKWYVNYADNILEGLWIAVLGLMVLNKHKITAWNPIKGPKKIRKRFRNHDESIIYNTLKLDSSYIRLISKANKSSQYSCINNK